jgi:tripartite-type tricarboxylate transporter receptor subunit TctC
MTSNFMHGLAGAAAVVGATLCVGVTAQAAEFPSKTITLVVGYAAGGGTDVLVRAVAEPLSRSLGQQVLVQNVPGAGGGVAAVRVAREPADGHALLVTTSSTFSLEPQLQKTAYEDKDFTHVATIAQFQGAIFANANKPFSSLKELVAHAKAEKRAIKHASYFQLDKLLMGYIAKKEGVEVVPVPVKGGSGAVQAVLQGDVDTAYSGGSWAPQAESGAAKPLFATSYDRLALAPELVSMKDLGYDIGTTSYMTVSAPAGTPPEVVKKLAAAFAEAVKAPVVQQVGEKRFMEVRAWGPAETREIIDTEEKAFAEMIAANE